MGLDVVSGFWLLVSHTHISTGKDWKIHIKMPSNKSQIILLFI